MLCKHVLNFHVHETKCIHNLYTVGSQVKHFKPKHIFKKTKENKILILQLTENTGKMYVGFYFYAFYLHDVSMNYTRCYFYNVYALLIINIHKK